MTDTPKPTAKVLPFRKPEPVKKSLPTEKEQLDQQLTDKSEPLGALWDQLTSDNP